MLATLGLLTRSHRAIKQPTTGYVDSLSPDTACMAPQCCSMEEQIGDILIGTKVCGAVGGQRGIQ